ncbi:MAG: hypothetical protein UR62_C0001G0021 [Candidatus Nomurabacteria bacterium GW2011_GWF2_35_12]|uniref:Uncharacterized protein n=3 Tax=Candidatus Nomuraibacteriota TaxID=1752729 RepID=A0A0G0DZJ7_9BACT|nr:MAG: hypothetical protein UR62_C0001G0021 [Candidatus Nomurabacteria bacterium GW2011_GWF2_35_12]KKP72589.1 MAG: hypothetical protein UR70_C0006G0040 [Candidatus Nomurabacteria bacterium GW2011_GWB1_35_20]KKP76616.1 MAG: hypothetical protein UR72_C0001G0061 [Parcubacteria group bacterium GW2011_GWC1_35_21]KKP78483.1 MAG: hypothetical protein UR77_C0002G0035 [Candidatus Nomurabacteria bacterium GW2011_GWC2_35_35]KKP88513.1 MAG: hypothetical protein UR92_C0003G0015 [Candidatus Nomurabacteria b
MYNSRYEDIGKPEITRRIDIFDYVRSFVRELEQLENKKIKFNNEFEAFRVKALMNIPEKTKFKSVNDLRGNPYWHFQEVDYVPSNLGKDRGVLFYFICSRCNRRIKYLYFYTEVEPPLCRKCCQLPYRPASYQERKIARESKLLTIGSKY